MHRSTTPVKLVSLYPVPLRAGVVASGVTLTVLVQPTELPPPFSSRRPAQALWFKRPYREMHGRTQKVAQNERTCYQQALPPAFLPLLGSLYQIVPSRRKEVPQIARYSATERANELLDEINIVPLCTKLLSPRNSPATAERRGSKDPTPGRHRRNCAVVIDCQHFQSITHSRRCQ